MTPLTPADHAALGTALAQAAQPSDVYRAVQQVLVARLGFHTSNPTAYPLGGLKRMGPTPWGGLVLERQQCYVTADAEGIRWAFPDHELIASLGLASAINVPMVAMGQVLGTINVLDVAGRYTEHDLPVVQSVAPYLVAPFLRDLQQA